VTVNEPPEETSADERRTSRIGVKLLVPYLLLYAGFMGLNVADPLWMSRNLGPLNVALWYGLALIVAALLLAILYTRLCRPPGGVSRS
jgi:uncharacterized membrane protein (DUF485 family)